MPEKGIGIPDNFLHARFVPALPDEYYHIKATLQTMTNRDRAEIICMVGTRCSTLLQKKGSKRSCRPPEQALFSRESVGRRSARRGRGRGHRSIQGCGRGGNSGTVGGSSSGGGSSSVSSASGSSHGDGSKPHCRCWRCNRRRHIREECTTKERDFLTKCARCSGFGQEESTCSSDAAVLAIELPMSLEDFSVEARAFVAQETSKYRVMVGEEVGSGELDKQVVQYIAGSAATCNMTPDPNGLTNYRECCRHLGLANGATAYIADHGDLPV